MEVDNLNIWFNAYVLCASALCTSLNLTYYIEIWIKL